MKELLRACLLWFLIGLCVYFVDVNGKMSAEDAFWHPMPFVVFFVIISIILLIADKKPDKCPTWLWVCQQIGFFLCLLLATCGPTWIYAFFHR